MKFLNNTTLVVAALLAAVGLQSNLSAAPLPAPLDSLGPNFLTFTGGASLAYNSNVLSASGGSSKFDDFVLDVNPGISLDYGKANEGGEGTFSYTESFLRYDRHPALDDELSNLGASYTRVQSRFIFTFNASYAQNYSNTPSSAGAGLTSIIRTDVISASGDVHWNFSDKFNFDAALQYTQTQYLYSVGQAFQNSDTYNIPVSAYYVYSSALSVGLGYTYTQTDPKASTGGSGRERETNALSVDAQLTEWQKLSGSANVGVTENSIAAGNTPGTSALTTTTGSYGMNLSYAYSAKVAFSLAGSRGFSLGSQGQNVESTSANLGVNYGYSDTIKLQANLLGYTYSQYLQSTRTDNTYTSGFTVSWQAYNWLTLSAGYTYFMNSSTLAGATYNINVITISGTIKY